MPATHHKLGEQQMFSKQITWIRAKKTCMYFSISLNSHHPLDYDFLRKQADWSCCCCCCSVLFSGLPCPLWCSQVVVKINNDSDANNNGWMVSNRMKGIVILPTSRCELLITCFQERKRISWQKKREERKNRLFSYFFSFSRPFSWNSVF